MSRISTWISVDYLHLSCFVVKSQSLFSILLNYIDSGGILNNHFSVYHDQFWENLLNSSCWFFLLIWLFIHWCLLFKSRNNRSAASLTSRALGATLDWSCNPCLLKKRLLLSAFDLTLCRSSGPRIFNYFNQCLLTFLLLHQMQLFLLPHYNLHILWPLELFLFLLLCLSLRWRLHILLLHLVFISWIVLIIFFLRLVLLLTRTVSARYLILNYLLLWWWGPLAQKKFEVSMYIVLFWFWGSLSLSGLTRPW